jgi:hypothetical protein
MTDHAIAGQLKALSDDTAHYVFDLIIACRMLIARRA